jgi:hypothetical protein
MVGRDSLNCLAKSLNVTFSKKCSRPISCVKSIFITPGLSGKKPVIEQLGWNPLNALFPWTLESFALSVSCRTHADETQ